MGKRSHYSHFPSCDIQFQSHDQPLHNIRMVLLVTESGDAISDSCKIHKDDNKKAFLSYPDPWNEGGKSVSEVGVVSEDVAWEERRNGRTIHCCIED